MFMIEALFAADEYFPEGAGPPGPHGPPTPQRGDFGAFQFVASCYFFGNVAVIKFNQFNFHKKVLNYYAAKTPPLEGLGEAFLLSA